MEYMACFLAVAQKVALLAVLLMVGFFSRKTGLLDDNASKRIGDIVMYLVTPCVIINAFSAKLYPREEMLEILRNLGIVALASVLLHFAMILVSKLLFRGSNEKYNRVMRFATVFSNCAYIALPLAQALIDNDTCHEGALYSAMYIAVFNIFCWTWGLMNMSDQKDIFSIGKIVKNPGIIGVVIGLAIFTTPLYLPNGGLQLPSVFKDAISSISSMNLPLPMFMVGFYLAGTNWRGTFRDKNTYICLALRLVLFPLLLMAVLYILGIRGNVFLTMVIVTGAPAATATTIFATKFDQDTELSVRLVSLSTVFSMVTLPLIVGLSKLLA